jgi:hypothetical protein
VVKVVVVVCTTLLVTSQGPGELPTCISHCVAYGGSVELSSTFLPLE